VAVLATAVVGLLLAEPVSSRAASPDRALPCTVVRPRPSCTGDDCDPETPLGKPFKTPVLLKRVAPRPPDRLRNSEGMVILEVVVSETGAVEAPCVTKSLDPSLDLSAVRAVKRWRFSPAELDGEPVKAITTVVVTFRKNRG
jgi:eukaryotic-like serine/threonine-protein kinase